MNYQKHYDALIERGKNRVLETYTEKHHIIPKCMGGTDDQENLVNLTPEEHYVAHQLLVKIYPEHKGLVWAALQLTGRPNGDRVNNKIYGWLKKKQSTIAKQRLGTKNGSYGRSWYHDPNTLKSGKFLPEEIPDGWIKGRVMNADSIRKIKDKRDKNHLKREKYILERKKLANEVYDDIVAKKISLNEYSKKYYDKSIVSLSHLLRNYCDRYEKKQGISIANRRIDAELAAAPDF